MLLMISKIMAGARRAPNRRTLLGPNRFTGTHEYDKASVCPHSYERRAIGWRGSEALRKPLNSANQKLKEGRGKYRHGRQAPKRHGREGESQCGRPG